MASGRLAGICGEPRPIAFCHLKGLDYVSCSPLHVPAARAALEMKDGAVAADL